MKKDIFQRRAGESRDIYGMVPQKYHAEAMELAVDNAAMHVAAAVRRYFSGLVKSVMIDPKFVRKNVSLSNWVDSHLREALATVYDDDDYDRVRGLFLAERGYEVLERSGLLYHLIGTNWANGVCEFGKIRDAIRRVFRESDIDIILSCDFEEQLHSGFSKEGGSGNPGYFVGRVDGFLSCGDDGGMTGNCSTQKSIDGKRAVYNERLLKFLEGVRAETGVSVCPDLR